nr:MAG TPA: hypothetical protein [Caudoviricetes sp.]
MALHCIVSATESKVHERLAFPSSPQVHVLKSEPV